MTFEPNRTLQTFDQSNKTTKRQKRVSYCDVMSGQFRTLAMFLCVFYGGHSKTLPAKAQRTQGIESVT